MTLEALPLRGEKPFWGIEQPRVRRGGDPGLMAATPPG